MAGFEISLVRSSEMSKNDSRTSGILAGLVPWVTAYFWFSHKLHLLCIFQTSEWYIRISDFYNPLARRSNAFNLKFLSLYGLVDLVMASFQTGLNQYWLIMNRTHYNFKLFRYLYPAHTRNFILICTTELLVLLTLVGQYNCWVKSGSTQRLRHLVIYNSLMPNDVVQTQDLGQHWSRTSSVWSQGIHLTVRTISQEMIRYWQSLRYV